MNVRKSMYERLLKSLEEAVSIASDYRYVLNKQDYPHDESDAEGLDRCRQTIRAGKAFIATIKEEQNDSSI